ncbi:MAG TPA: sigma factor [Lapillicoccus sp.]
MPELVLDRDDAVAVLFHRHSTDLVGLAFCLLGDREAAEEVVQDAFVALHRHWRDLREQAAALAYLRAAVVNGCGPVTTSVSLPILCSRPTHRGSEADRHRFRSVRGTFGIVARR